MNRIYGFLFIFIKKKKGGCFILFVNELSPSFAPHSNPVGGVGLQIYKMINLGSNVIVYKLKHCVLYFEVNMMTF